MAFEDFSSVDLNSVASYVLVRNPALPYLFNIVALDDKDDFVFVHSTDHLFDVGSELVNILNSEINPV